MLFLLMIKAAATGVKMLKEYGASSVAVEGFDSNFQSAAEGSVSYTVTKMI